MQPEKELTRNDVLQLIETEAKEHLRKPYVLGQKWGLEIQNKYLPMLNSFAIPLLPFDEKYKHWKRTKNNCKHKNKRSGQSYIKAYLINNKCSALICSQCNKTIRVIDTR